MSCEIRGGKSGTKTGCLRVSSANHHSTTTQYLKCIIVLTPSNTVSHPRCFKLDGPSSLTRYLAAYKDNTFYFVNYMEKATKMNLGTELKVVNKISRTNRAINALKSG
jgi:hypothetical protein